MAPPAVQYSRVQYSTAGTTTTRYSTVQYSTVQYSWYYHDQVEREPDHISTKPRSPPHIGREIINFEKDLLKDLR